VSLLRRALWLVEGREVKRNAPALHERVLKRGSRGKRLVPERLE